MILKKVFFIVSFTFLIYLLLPGPARISDFIPLQNSVKSQLDGDTVQVPNVVGYFSNNYRDLVIPFYVRDYKSLTWIPFPPIRLNYPPEYAFNAIKQYTESTYLEEYVYPLRDSLYVNGFEPINADGSQRYQGARILGHRGREFNTKVTLRFYPSPIWARVMVWLGIESSVVFLWLLIKRELNG